MRRARAEEWLVRNEPSVSIALATYNGESHIRKQLNSLADQTVPPDEIVIGDDGSSDSTLAVIAEFAKSVAFPVRILPPGERLGYRANFMRIGASCLSDLIFFCDQDDYWHPAKIGAIREEFRLNPELLLCYHNANVVSADSGFLYRLYDKKFQELATSSIVPFPFHFSLGFTQAYRSTLHRYDLLWPESIDPHSIDFPLAHDQWFFLLAMSLGQVSYIDEGLVDYLQHGSNVFGAGHNKISRLNRYREKLFGNATKDANLEIAAEAASAILKRIADKLPMPTSQRVHSLAARYDMLQTWRAQRNEIRRSRSLLARFGAFASNLRHGAYIGTDPWRFGAPALAGEAVRVFWGPSSKSVAKARVP